ncbi:phage holin family protein [Youxingia wuxianensis]|uniref:phage holin family protein n=1 Tax=Youxingia wuxianensis TaxID=2763678 RepID=UPI0021CC5D12|nr:phage holin family protein [Youxingia wuxianensis]
MNIQDYIKPELLVLIPVLYITGLAVKASKIKDSLIPSILGAVSITLAALWVFATTPMRLPQDLAMGIFISITQGILAAGASVFFNQLKKQAQKND